MCSDMAFDAVDTDGSNSIDVQELSLVMRQVAADHGIIPPNDLDIDFIMGELDENNDGSVDRSEFIDLIILILGKMLEAEE